MATGKVWTLDMCDVVLRLKGSTTNSGMASAIRKRAAVVRQPGAYLGFMEWIAWGSWRGDGF